MQRTRIWVNFSKEYKEEYDKCIKEDNFSKLVCKLLRQYYKNNKDLNYDLYGKIDEIYNLLKNNSIEIENSIDDNNDFDIW